MYLEPCALVVGVSLVLRALVVGVSLCALELAPWSLRLGGSCWL